jgi:hypothetical protein
MKLTWITDVHLNFLKKDERIDFRGQVLYKDLTLKEYNHDKEKEYLFA